MKLKIRFYVLLKTQQKVQQKILKKLDLLKCPSAAENLLLSGTRAIVLECLGTKNLIADEMRKITGKTYYDIIAHDTVATFINDLTTVGAKPLVVNAYWAIEDNSWMLDTKKMEDF